MNSRVAGLVWLAAFALVGAGAVAWLSWPATEIARPIAPPVGDEGGAPPPDGAAGQPPVPAGSRAQALDQIEAAEAETLGAEEAARRRRQRERMLELRAEEH